MRMSAFGGMFRDVVLLLLRFAFILLVRGTSDVL